MPVNVFEGRRLLIATKHKKEEVIAPILERELGVICSVVANFDTDQLGTFSGEIERANSPIVTAKQKCLQAMESENYDLCVASEGSFGPHPSLPFIAVDEEWLVLIDKIHQLEIPVKELTTETNFNGSLITTEKELLAFCESAKFPSHGLILKKSKEDTSEIIKGITNQPQLEQSFHLFQSRYGKAYIETDMRALYNPTRMKVIERTTLKLVNAVKTVCPTCKTPGFAINRSIEGLPCAWCNHPTRGIISHIHSCQKCEYTQEEKYPTGKQFADPMYCDVCNP